MIFAPSEHHARIAAALSTRDADKVRTRRKAEKPQAVSEPEIVEPADVRWQMDKLQACRRRIFRRPGVTRVRRSCARLALQP